MPPAVISKAHMPLILSLQGCMAAGKTTAARYIASHAPDIHAMPEDNLGVIDDMHPQEVGRAAIAWARACIARHQAE